MMEDVFNKDLNSFKQNCHNEFSSLEVGNHVGISDADSHIDYWKAFEKSGRIEDYLKCKTLFGLQE